MRFFITVTLCVVLALTAIPVYARNTVPLVTSGRNASVDQGDDDFKQVIFFQVPETVSGQVYVRVFDPDCGGAWDEVITSVNTQTRFEVFGGTGAFSAPSLKNFSPDEADLRAGQRIESKTFGENSFTDNKWFTLAECPVSAGEKIDGVYYLKLVIEGLDGDDGNVFDVTLSLDPHQNKPPEGLKILSFSPTIHLVKGYDRFAELRVFIPQDLKGIRIRNFDLEHASVWFETPYASYPLSSSDNDQWKENSLSLDPGQTGQMCGVILQSFSDRRNSAVFHMLDSNDVPLPFELPILHQRGNQRPVPAAAVEYLSDCHSVVFDGSGSTDADSDFLEYEWNFGDGQKGNGARVTHRYEKFGQYSAEMIVRDDSGRIANRAGKPFAVTLNEPPQAGAGLDQVGIPGQKLSFNGSESRDPDGKILRYVWDFGDRTRASGPVVSYAYPYPGIYRVRLYVEDDSQSPCNSGTDEAEVWINARPVLDLGPDRISAAGESVTFDGNNSFDSDGQLTAFLWDLGDGNQAEGRTASHAYAKPGKYTVTLTVKDNAGVENSSVSDSLVITVNDPPVAKARVKQVRAAVGEAVEFDSDESIDPDGSLIGHTWAFGDGNSGQGLRIAHAYQTPGTYTVKLTVQDDSKTLSDKAEDSLTVIINDPPVAHAGQDQKVTVSKVHFDGGASADPDGSLTAFDWDFGDGSKGTGAKTSHVYSRPGTYGVVLTVTDDSGTSTRQHSDGMTVVVNEKPSADAGIDHVGIPGESLSFDGRGSFDPDGQIVSYEWDFGDGTSDKGPAVVHAYAAPGTYAIRLKVTDDTGHDLAVGFDQAKAVINHQPSVSAGPDVSAAPGDVIPFQARAYDPDGRIISYTWTFSDGQSPANKTSEIRKTSEICCPGLERSFSEPGIYTAVVTVTDNSGAANSQAQDSIKIHINNPPLAAAGSDIHTCDLTIVVDGSGSSDPDGDSLSYVWDFGDGSPPQKGIRQVHTYEKGGKYPILLTMDDFSGLKNAAHAASINAAINRPPIADAGKSQTVCAGQVVLFNGAGSSDPEGGQLKYLWDFGDNTSAEGLNPSTVYKTGGIYPVTLAVEDDSGLECNADQDQILIRVAEAPIADAGPDQSVCANTVAAFDGSNSRDFDGVVNGFSWDFGDGTTGGGKNPTHVFTLAGTYRVALTVTGDQIGDCDNTHTDEMTVQVFEAPRPVVKAPSMAASGQKVVFDSSASTVSQVSPGNSSTAGESSVSSVGITSRTWDLGDGTSADGEKIEHVYETPGKYTVTLTVKTDSGTGCSTSSVLHLLTVNAAPVAEAGGDREAAVNERVLFSGAKSSDSDGAVTKYHWDFGDGQTAEGVDVRHQYAAPGKYPVTLTVTDNTDMSNNQNSKTLHVQVNAPPTAVFEMDKPAYCAGEEIRFDGGKSSDTDGGITDWTWDFGDGKTADGREVSHAYQTPGVYSALLTVNDGQPVLNHLGKTLRKIIVNHPPLADAGPDMKVCAGQPARFDASGSTDADGTITGYFWDFGDGASAQGLQTEHVFENPGRYTVKLSLKDDSGSGCAAGTDEIAVIVNAPPKADGGSDREAYAGGAHDAVLFDASASSDPDAEPFICSWDFGDGDQANGPMVFHAFKTPGKYKVQLRVQDGSGLPCGENVQEITVVVKPHEKE